MTARHRAGQPGGRDASDLKSMTARDMAAMILREHNVFF
jgi:hypothetical protein